MTEKKSNKKSSSKMSSLAARILKGYVPTIDEIKSLAASVLSQDEEKGNNDDDER